VGGVLRFCVEWRTSEVEVIGVDGEPHA
jgi:hypothetical protein